MGDDALGTLGLDVAPFRVALNQVNAEMADLLIESKKLNAEIALLERQMFLTGGGTKAQAKELGNLKSVSEDFTQQIKKAKEEQKAFGAVTEEASVKMEKAAKSGFNLGNALAGIGRQALMALGIGSIVELGIKIHHAVDEAKKLNEEFDKIGVDNGNPEFKTLDEVEKRLGRINALLEKLQTVPSDAEAGGSVLAQIVMNPSKYAKQFGIAGATRGIAGIGQIFDQAGKDLAESNAAKEKSALEEKNKSEANIPYIKNRILSYKDTQDFEKSISDENKAYDEQRQKQKTAQEKKASDDFDTFKDGILKENQEFDKQRADKHQKDKELAQKEENEFQEGIQKENKAFDEQKVKEKKAAADLKKQTEARQTKTHENLQNQAEVSATRREDGPIAASREAISQKYQDRIEAAIRDNDPETEALLRKQQNDELAKYDVAQTLQTPAQHRDQVNATRREARDEVHARDRNRDLDDRLSRGARGSEHSRLEERRRQNQKDAERAQKGEAARHEDKNGKDNDPFKQATDYLKDIRDSLQDKD